MLLLLAALLLSTTTNNTLARDWLTTSQSVVRVYPCGQDLCAKIVKVEASAPAAVDGKNPDEKLRSRSLCGLVIGTGFHKIDSTHAEGGKLYDPKTGSTYQGTLALDGDTLKLRGFIGLSVFGRTEIWKPAPGPVAECKVK